MKKNKSNSPLFKFYVPQTDTWYTADTPKEALIIWYSKTFGVVLPKKYLNKIDSLVIGACERKLNVTPKCGKAGKYLGLLFWLEDTNELQLNYKYIERKLKE